MQTLSEKIAGDKFKDKEKVLAERALEQMRSGDHMRAEILAKLKNIDREIADEAERCLGLLLHGTYLCGAFVTSLKTSETATLRKNTAKARKTRRESKELL